jgi:hypothetical protein
MPMQAETRGEGWRANVMSQRTFLVNIGRIVCCGEEVNGRHKGIKHKWCNYVGGASQVDT